MVVNESYRPLSDKEAAQASMVMQMNGMREKLIYFFVHKCPGTRSEIDEKIANTCFHIDQIQRELSNI